MILKAAVLQNTAAFLCLKTSAVSYKSSAVRLEQCYWVAWLLIWLLGESR
ncbi:hypothetical protein P20311_0082 [Pseudoalteromonas sp. BSi20311]|nr:hypothetical protein P20311_0082 [Pseudoalteromonas sp. BSi20311]